MINNYLREYEHYGNCKIVIDFRNIETRVPIFRTYRYNMNFKAFLEPLSGSVFITNFRSTWVFRKDELKIPHNATLSYKSTYIGKGDNILISLECITNKHFIRKLKIENIING